MIAPEKRMSFSCGCQMSDDFSKMTRRAKQLAECKQAGYFDRQRLYLACIQTKIEIGIMKNKGVYVQVPLIHPAGYGEPIGRDGVWVRLVTHLISI